MVSSLAIQDDRSPVSRIKELLRMKRQELEENNMLSPTEVGSFQRR